MRGTFRVEHHASNFASGVLLRAIRAALWRLTLAQALTLQQAPLCLSLFRAILEEIERKKASTSAQQTSTPVGNAILGVGHGPPPPPPPIGPPPSMGSDPMMSPEMQRLTTQKEAELRHRSASETMDTLLLMGEKDNEINSLRSLLQSAEERVEELEKAASRPAGVPAPPPALNPAVVEESEAKLAEAIQREELMQDKVSGLEAQLAKLQAKLTAVSTLYTESMQREAVLKVQLDQLNLS